MLKRHLNIVVCLLIAIFAQIIFGAAPSYSGELVDLNKQIKHYEIYEPDLGMSCTHRFVGPFQKGDAQKIISANPAYLCLDSPGGSLLEALKLTAFMNKQPTPTKIEAGAKCESACALVFMAGAFNPHEGSIFLWRVLSPSGKLGFHAPDLQISDGNYNKRSVKQAYHLALKSVSAIISELVQRRGFGGSSMKSSLLKKIVETPSESMFYVDTVDHAGRWNIQVGPLPKVTNPSPEMLVRACVNAFAWRVDEPARFANPNQDFWPDNDGKKGVTKGRVLINEMLETGCSFKVDPKSFPPIEMKFDDGQRYWPTAITFTDPNLQLADLVKKKLSHRPANSPTGFCYLDRQRPNVMNDSELCILRETRTSTKQIKTYEWPSGKKTIVSMEHGKISIDGVGADKIFVSSSLGKCLQNPKSKTLFCYRERQNH